MEWRAAAKIFARQREVGAVKLSVVIAAKNEHDRLPDCLASVKFADEIVVVDDNSTDDTASMARTAGAKVYARRLDGFAAQKNFGIDRASNDWILILDADERVTPELAAEIQALQPEQKVYAIKFRNFVGQHWLKHGGLYPDWHDRLFDRRAARYGQYEGEQRQSHEMLEYSGERGYLQHDILHLTYRDWADYRTKVMKYARLEAAWAKPRRYRFALKVFLAKFFKEQGYRDGLAGLHSAWLLAYYQIVLVRAMKQGEQV